MSQAMQKIAQRKFVKGVSASPQTFGQPEGTIPRASNIVMTRRGSLLVCDGTQIITEYNGAVQPFSTGLGPLTETFLYEPIGLPNSYYALAKDYNTQFGSVIGLAAADGGGGGNLSAGTYLWAVTALDGAGGESLQSNHPTLTLLVNHKANLTWTVMPFATGYNVYRTVAGGGTFFLVNTSPVTTNSYVDNVADANLGTQQPPATDTTQVSQFYNLVVPSYGAANIVKTFPADTLPSKDGTGGGFGGGGAGAGGGGSHPPSSGGQPPTPAGGVAGNLSPIPQIVQFANNMILAMGNGIAPYQSDGTTGGTIPLTNTFTATYPGRFNSTAQAVGDLITVTVGGTAYVFKATQGGITAAAAPTFPSGLNQTVADGGVIWVNIGPVGTNPAPRGAAHAIVYAGSLWIFNTSPTNTSDGIDGPSCLKMSDTNNPTSWNPLNVAFLDKDDGSQGMGLAVYTIAEAGIAPTGSLVAFKEFSTFQIIGVFGAADFSIQRAQTDMGCVAPRSIQFVPGFGIMRLTHLGFAVFDGVRDRIVSEEIRPYIFAGLPDLVPADWNYVWFSKAALTANPPMYCCAVPLQNLVTNSNPSITWSVSIASGTSSRNLFYFKLAGVSADGNTFTMLGTEQSITTGSTLLCPQINLPSGAGFAKFRIFMTPFFTPGAPGTESQYVDVPASATSVLITMPSAAYFPGNVAGNYAPGGIGSNLGQMKRLFCYDLVLKGWLVVDLPFAISTLKQYRSVGTIPITTMTGFYDGALRRWQAGDPTWDAGATVAGAPDTNRHWNFRSAEVFGKNASDRVYFRRISIRGVGNPTGLAATFTTNGLGNQTFATQNFNVQLFGAGEFAAYCDLALTCLDAYVQLTGSTAASFEIQSVDWSYMPKPVGGLVVAG